MQKSHFETAAFTMILSGIALIIIAFVGDVDMDFFMKLGGLTFIHGLAVMEATTKMLDGTMRPNFKEDPIWLVVTNMISIGLLLGGFESFVAFMAFDVPIHPALSGASFFIGLILAACLQGEEDRRHIGAVQ